MEVLEYNITFCEEILGTSHTDYVDRLGVLERSLLMQRRRSEIHCWRDRFRGQITAGPTSSSSRPIGSHLNSIIAGMFDELLSGGP